MQYFVWRNGKQELVRARPAPINMRQMPGDEDLLAHQLHRLHTHRMLISSHAGKSMKHGGGRALMAARPEGSGTSSGYQNVAPDKFVKTMLPPGLSDAAAEEHGDLLFGLLADMVVQGVQSEANPLPSVFQHFRGENAEFVWGFGGYVFVGAPPDSPYDLPHPAVALGYLMHKRTGIVRMYKMHAVVPPTSTPVSDGAYHRVSMHRGDYIGVLPGRGGLVFKRNPAVISITTSTQLRVSDEIETDASSMAFAPGDDMDDDDEYIAEIEEGGSADGESGDEAVESADEDAQDADDVEVADSDDEQAVLDSILRDDEMPDMPDDMAAMTPMRRADLAYDEEMDRSFDMPARNLRPRVRTAPTPGTMSQRSPLRRVSEVERRRAMGDPYAPAQTRQYNPDKRRRG